MTRTPNHQTLSLQSHETPGKMLGEKHLKINEITAVISSFGTHLAQTGSTSRTNRFYVSRKQVSYSGAEFLPGHIAVVDDAWCQERHERVEYLRVLLSARVARDRPHVQREILDKASILKLVECQHRLGLGGK